MKKFLALALLALPLAAQDGFDFKALDKLGANSKNRTNVTLDGDMLKMAAGFLGAAGNSNKDAADVKTLVDSLKGVYIRSWEFDQKGMYSAGDLEPLRAYLRAGKWNRVVESKKDDELSEIYLLPQPGGKLGGVAIVSAEAKEVTVVYIAGSLRTEDIAKLSGSMGIPDIGSQLGNLKKGDKGEKGDKGSAKTKEED